MPQSSYLEYSNNACIGYLLLYNKFFRKPSGLKQQHFLSQVSVGQESRCGLVDSSTFDSFTGFKVSAGTAYHGFTVEDSISKLIHEDAGRIQSLWVIGLRLSSSPAAELPQFLVTGTPL